MLDTDRIHWHNPQDSRTASADTMTVGESDSHYTSFRLILASDCTLNHRVCNNAALYAYTKAQT